MVDEALTPSCKQEIANGDAWSLGTSVKLEALVAGSLETWVAAPDLVAGATIKLDTQVSKKQQPRDHGSQLIDVRWLRVVKLADEPGQHGPWVSCVMGRLGPSIPMNTR